MSDFGAIERVRKRIKKVKEKLENDSVFLGGLAKVMAKQVKARTRLGKGVKESGGSTYNLSEVLRTDDYEDYREDLAEIKELSEWTTPLKHNLTLKGYLLDAVKGRHKSGHAEIYVEDTRPDGRRNSKIIDGQRKLGREFLNLSKQEKRQANRVVRKKLERELEKEFK